MNESRRGFLGRLMAGGFGLAVGQAVTVQVATAEEAELVKAPMILPPFPGDVLAVANGWSPPIYEMSGASALHHINVDFFSADYKALRQLFETLHMGRFSMRETATSPQPRAGGLIGA
jgi:hypothetical protein